MTAQPRPRAPRKNPNAPIVRAQRALVALGLTDVPVHGELDERTRRALASFGRAVRLPPEAALSLSLLAALEACAATEGAPPGLSPR